MSNRIVFMGSPEFAIPSLQSLANNFSVVGVITQPDRPAGRGRILAPPPVKELANALGIPVIQPSRMREPNAMETLRAWNPDVIVVAAFGQILRSEVLDLPTYGCINVHGSLLPRWRGATPIQAAILHGDTQTGVTIMKMDPGIDTGPILNQSEEPIYPDDTSETLGNRLAILGAKLLLDTLPGYFSGLITPQAQNDAFASYAPMLKKEDGKLDFSQPAEWLARQVRAYHPWPGAFTNWEGGYLKILKAQAYFDVKMSSDSIPGTRIIFNNRPAFITSQGILVIDELQPAGKRPLQAHQFLAGAKNWGHPIHG